MAAAHTVSIANFPIAWGSTQANGLVAFMAGGDFAGRPPIAGWLSVVSVDYWSTLK